MPSITSRTLMKAALALGVASAFSAPAAAVVTIAPSASTGSSTDLFQGATVTQSTPTFPGFSVADIFGATASVIEPGNTVFADGLFAFSVFFDLGTATVTSGYNLFLADDSAGNGTPNRGTSSFILAGSNDNVSFTTLSSASLSTNYLASYGSAAITASDSYAPVAFRYYRLTGASVNALNARIVELDGFAPIVPEPATWAMMIGGIGLSGGALRRRRAEGRVAARA